MTKFYTKTGDGGETSLRYGKRISKNDLLVEAYGTIDELNSIIAVAIAHLSGRLLTVKNQLLNTQRDLMHICALMAGEEKDKDKRIKHLRDRIGVIERKIDEIQGKLPKQTKFYLPGGNRQAAYIDCARAVCRRAERKITGLPPGASRLPVNLKYLNRLSDYLYALARWTNFEGGFEERVWNSELKTE